MQPFLRYAKQSKEALISDIAALVQCESPSDSPADVNRCVDLLIEQSRDIAAPKIVKSAKFGNHLRLDFKLPGRPRKGRILGIGHSDTVWPLGTLRSMPYRRKKGRLWGPGVLDMNAVIFFFVHAESFLLERFVKVERKVKMLGVQVEAVSHKDARTVSKS